MKSTSLSKKAVILGLLVATCVSADSTLRTRLKLNKPELDTHKGQVGEDLIETIKSVG